MRRRIKIASVSVLLAALLVNSSLLQAADRDDEKTGAKHRLEFMKKQFNTFHLYAEGDFGKPLARTDEPVLRYSNPVRNFFSDGATFLWLSGKRPAAVASMSIRGKGQVAREFTSLSTKPYRCLRDKQVIWSPRKGGLLNQPLADARPPVSSAKLRLTQMRQLARRFKIAFKAPDSKGLTNVRLLTQPLYRYADEDSGIVDGALFAFSQSNDSEAPLLLEAYQPDGEVKPAWRFTLAKMTSVPIVVQLDDREAWSVKGYWRNPRSPNDPYMEALEGKYAPPPGTDIPAKKLRLRRKT